MKQRIALKTSLGITLWILLIGQVGTASPYAGGDGSIENPYLISTPEQLMVMSSSDPNHNYRLISDIDMTNVNFENSIDALKFTDAVFDGNGKTISNLSLISSNNGAVALFTTLSGTIQNLTLSNPVVTNPNASAILVTSATLGSAIINVTIQNGIFITTLGGCLVGMSGGTISNVHVNCTATLTNTNQFGTFSGGILVGMIYGGSITNSTTSGSIVGMGNVVGNFLVGGVIGSVDLNSGLLSSIDISNSSSSANVSSSGQAGGFIGQGSFDNPSGTLTITNSHATGSVTITNGGFAGGGFAGTLVDTTVSIDHCYSTGLVSGNGNLGGFVGATDGVSIRQSYATGSVIGTGKMPWYNGTSAGTGGFVGIHQFLSRSTTSSISNCYSTGSVNNEFSDVNSSLPRIQQCASGGFAAESLGSIINSYAIGRVFPTHCPNRGGLVGLNLGGSVINCFWDRLTTTMASSAGGTMATTSQMQDSNGSLYTNAANSKWDFLNIWNYPSSGGVPSYPTLK